MNNPTKPTREEAKMKAHSKTESNGADPERGET